MKTPQLSPYLTFNGNCREAMTFYHQCLGGELQVQTFAETPAAGHVTPDAQHGVMHACLSSESLVLFGSDAGMQQVTPGNSVALALNFSSPEGIAAAFASLGQGGSVTMPLEDTFWGATFGMLTDRFGTNWMFNYDKKPAQ
ncbi:VOC family protein [Hymenobacter sp. BT635]|uniref:VOC family protein n=1 Tax=Hymenobacter nitidus TaxID=2880929 RepID=A0ABS8ABJ4_9BACT|nr:VOC family protein [Hymenobacter nitidus]MCB2376404.1 VOC family protein [Hymenobacter nitidus]